MTMPDDRTLVSPMRGPHPATREQESVPAAGSAAPAPTPADLPSIESLDEDSDYSPFLSPQVSTGLRRRALRKLFGLPRFQGSDGLDDYDEDYRRFTALGDTITHEMRRMLETEVRRADRVADRKEDAMPSATGGESTPDSAAAEVRTPPDPDNPPAGPRQSDHLPG